VWGPVVNTALNPKLNEVSATLSLKQARETAHNGARVAITRAGGKVDELSMLSAHFVILMRHASAGRAPGWPPPNLVLCCRATSVGDGSNRREYRRNPTARFEHAKTHRRGWSQWTWCPDGCLRW
jgi:hypothetical protein